MSVTTGATVTTVMDHLIEAIRLAGTYNRNDQCPPVVVLWTDEARLFEGAIPQLLRRDVPVLVLGDYCPDEHRGPAVWIRCVLAERISGIELRDGMAPVIYLPGYGRHHLRAVEDCPDEARPLAELQFRGSWFTQGSGRDWTPLALLVNEENGVGLVVAGGAATSEAIQATLVRLLDEPVSKLKERGPLSASDFYELSEGDVVGSVLRWMDDPDSFRFDHPDWEAFRQLCKKVLTIDPEDETVIGAAQHLGERRGEWQRAWRRFEEAPTNYPHLPDLLRAARPASSLQQELFGGSSADSPWPQDNEDAEQSLRHELNGLSVRAPDVIRARLRSLDAEHAPRRSSVWAKLDHAPLAVALGHLVALATATESHLAGATFADLVVSYSETAWQADDSLLRLLSAVERSDDVADVAAVASALYRPWAEAGAVRFLEAFAAEAPSQGLTTPIELGTCRIFTDGLRFDLGQRLAGELRRRHLEVVIASTVAAVPTVTATAKPAVAPVGGRIAGGDGLGAKAIETGSSLTADSLRRLIAAEGVQTLGAHEFGDPTGRAWTELGDIDQLGHAHGVRLARYVDDQVRAIADRIAALLKAGWRQVEVVTDHGWMLDPLGLEKVVPPLPEALTTVRKGRCARVSDHASVEFPTLPWYFDSGVAIALAPGLRAFEAGKAYEHGGVSPQESITPHLVVRRGASPVALSIGEVRWVGLRCRVRVDDAPTGSAVDLRLNPAQPDTSIAVHLVEIDADGSASLLTSSDEHEGRAAAVVVVAADGTVLGQHPTFVGGP